MGDFKKIFSGCLFIRKIIEQMLLIYSVNHIDEKNVIQM